MEKKILVFQKDEVICHAGNFEVWMYEIQSGSVGIYRDYGLPTQRKLGVVTDGYLGEMGLIGNRCRIATAVAEEETTLTMIDKESYVNYFIHNPEKLTSIMVCLAGRMNSINEDYMKACKTIRDYLKVEEANKSKHQIILQIMKKYAGKLRFWNS